MVRVTVTGLRLAVGWQRGARGSQLETANGPATPGGLAPWLPDVPATPVPDRELLPAGVEVLDGSDGADAGESDD
jgi:hypothetical protein